MVLGLGFGVWGLGFGVWGLGLGFRVEGLGYIDRFSGARESSRFLFFKEHTCYTY